MNALKMTLIASLAVFGTAHAAGDEPPVETIVVTAKRPAFIVSDESILVVTVTAPAPVIPEVVAVAPEDSVVIELPKSKPAVIVPKLEQPKLSLAPVRNELALAESNEPQG
jgi:hypothetical protein